MKIQPVTIASALWQSLISDLKVRGNNQRESGAFLLADHGSRTVREYLCYEDLDEDASEHAYIVFNGGGYVRLWRHCAENRATVIADVHTHPGPWVGQSETDEENPMISTPGHVALIVPEYANVGEPEAVGVYVYEGEHKWLFCPEAFIVV